MNMMNMNNYSYLSLIIWISLIGGVVLILLNSFSSNVSKSTAAKIQSGIRPLALIISLLCLLLCIPMLAGFNTATHEMQFTELHNWIPSFGIYYRLGVDGFSLPLIVLTCFMTVLVVLASYRSVKDRIASYLASFLIMQGFIVGALAALDAILFYFFWEGMLIPMFLIIGVWGGANRIYATIKFFLYTFLGSVLFLVALIYLRNSAINAGHPTSDVFNILTFHALPLSFEAQKWIFIAFLVAFAVKVPMFPVHTWLPDAHVEAPTGGSVILAAILLKMGGYGFLRFLLPITPDASEAFAFPVIVLSLIAIIYIAFIALIQKDMKKLIAYSSISHMGFVTLGFFVAYGVVMRTAGIGGAESGIEGGMVQMVSHGFVSAALFLCVGVLYDRLHSRLIQDYGGIASSMPIFASFFVLFAMANVGLPGTSGFVGEFLVILSSFKANVWYSVGAATILVLGASYTLWMVKRVVFGRASTPEAALLKDLSLSEKLIFISLALAVLWLGIWPAPLLDMMHASSQHLVEQMMQTKL